MISIWADGASTGKVGPGGYGWILVEKDVVLSWGYGGSPVTTNNLMEMQGLIEGMKEYIALGLSGVSELVSDSQISLGLASGSYSPNKNVEQAEELRELAKKIGCRCRWVKGHAGHKYNELCDQLARQGKKENTR